jgi:hypothetical protein
MRRFTIGWMLGIGLLLTTRPATAEVLRVNCETGPYTEIDAAVDAAADGDTVLVDRCALGPYAPFDVVGKEGVHVLSALGRGGGSGARSEEQPAAGFRPSAIIDGDGGFQCILIADSDGVTLQGFAIRNCGFHAIEVLTSIDTSVIGNRIDGGVEAIRDQSSSHSRYLDNVIVGGIFSIFLDGDDALVAGNRVEDDLGGAISILNSRNQVVDNGITGSGAEGILDQAFGSRIERNRVLGNGGAAQIVLNSGSSDADVISNVTGNSILDFGTGTDLADNR